jgi:hypothetical protein
MIVTIVPLSRAEIIALFPTGGAIPEELQIGRSQAIADLTAASEGGQTLIFAEDRHLGKSSLLLAMTNRVLAVEGNCKALSVDLRDGISDSEALAEAFLNQANRQHAGLSIKAMFVKNKLSNLGPKPLERLRAAGELLGETDELSAATKLAELLTPSGATVRRALLALDAHGHAIGGRTIIILDEVQDLLRWKDALDVQHEIAAAIKRANSTVSFVFSGSEMHTLAGLYEDKNAPLHGLGRRFPLPIIARDDWCKGLARRFSHAGIDIDSAQLHQILFYSEGHPLRTMLICAHMLDWLDGSRASVDTVTRAVEDAQRHPSWSAA